MEKREGWLAPIVKGGLASVVGTIVLTGGVKFGPTLLRKIGIDAPEPPAKAKQNKPPEQLAQKIAQDVFDTRLSSDEKEIAGQALHWSYGVGWGMIYGLTQSRLRLPHLLHGTLVALFMIATAFTLVPAMGIAPQARKIPMEQKVLQASFIMLYGWTTAIVYGLLSKK